MNKQGRTVWNYRYITVLFKNILTRVQNKNDYKDIFTQVPLSIETKKIVFLCKHALFRVQFIEDYSVSFYLEILKCVKNFGIPPPDRAELYKYAFYLVYSPESNDSKDILIQFKEFGLSGFFFQPDDFFFRAYDYALFRAENTKKRLSIVQDAIENKILVINSDESEWSRQYNGCIYTLFHKIITQVQNENDFKDIFKQVSLWADMKAIEMKELVKSLYDDALDKAHLYMKMSYLKLTFYIKMPYWIKFYMKIPYLKLTLITL